MKGRDYFEHVELLLYVFNAKSRELQTMISKVYVHT